MDVICVIAVIAQRKLLAYVFTCCLVYLFSCSRCSSFSTVLLVAAITYFLKLGHNNHGLIFTVVTLGLLLAVETVGLLQAIETMGLLRAIETMGLLRVVETMGLLRVVLSMGLIWAV